MKLAHENSKFCETNATDSNMVLTRKIGRKIVALVAQIKTIERANLWKRERKSLALQAQKICAWKDDKRNLTQKRFVLVAQKIIIKRNKHFCWERKRKYFLAQIICASRANYYRLQNSCPPLIKKKKKTWTFASCCICVNFSSCCICCNCSNFHAATCCNAATFLLVFPCIQKSFAWVCLYATNAATRKVYANAATSKSSCFFFFFDEGGAWILQSVIQIAKLMRHPHQKKNMNFC